MVYGAFQFSYSHTHYKNGTKKGLTDPDGIVYQYSYDANNQLTGVEMPGKGFITCRKNGMSIVSLLSCPLCFFAVGSLFFFIAVVRITFR